MVGSVSGRRQMRWFRSGNMAVLLLALSLLAPSCGFKALAAETVVDASGRRSRPVREPGS
ncbi:hypothetical protein [Mesorhizobium sp.]|uniref:hypothetical protein n=1 Tax=Mesorhizobium sp. TaxID=1871066 RepID=UPI00257E8D90|nr:hypothetical protein [Mesorhizobium sp.]